MKKTTAHGRRLRRNGLSAQQAEAARAAKSQTAKALDAQKIAQCLAMTDAFLLRISTQAYLASDGVQDLELLSKLAVLLGIGAEIGIVTAEDAPQTRRMHAALRTVLQMSVDGGCWRSSQAKVLHEAAALAAAAFKAHPLIGLARYRGAQELGDKIMLGTARMGDVVGVEVYQKQPEAA